MKEQEWREQQRQFLMQMLFTFLTQRLYIQTLQMSQIRDKQESEKYKSLIQESFEQLQQNDSLIQGLLIQSQQDESLTQELCKQLQQNESLTQALLITLQQERGEHNLVLQMKDKKHSTCIQNLCKKYELVLQKIGDIFLCLKNNDQKTIDFLAQETQNFKNEIISLVQTNDQLTQTNDNHEETIRKLNNALKVSSNNTQCTSYTAHNNSTNQKEKEENINPNNNDTVFSSTSVSSSTSTTDNSISRKRKNSEIDDSTPDPKITTAAKILCTMKQMS
jgi:hypothetical protein